MLVEERMPVQWHKALSHNLHVGDSIVIVGVICYFYFLLSSILVSEYVEQLHHMAQLMLSSFIGEGSSILS